MLVKFLSIVSKSGIIFSLNAVSQSRVEDEEDDFITVSVAVSFKTSFDGEEDDDDDDDDDDSNVEEDISAKSSSSLELSLSKFPAAKLASFFCFLFSLFFLYLIRLFSCSFFRASASASFCLFSISKSGFIKYSFWFINASNSLIVL